MQRGALGLVALALLAACTTSRDSSPATDAGPVTVKLLTHDSFDVTRSVLRGFEERTGISVQIVPVGDAGQLANRLILEAGNPEGDVAFGIDNNQLADVLGNDVFAPSSVPGLASVPDRYTALDPSLRAVPIDHGEVCVNDDLAAFSGGAPATLEDLADPRFRGQLVVENPATSTPGLAFLLATVAAFGDPGFEQYWRDVRANDVTVVDGWERAYFGEFSGASGGDGTHPLVVSYATSPVAEVVYADPPVDTAPTGVLTETCYEQVEFAGVLEGTEQPAAAAEVLDFLLSRGFQEDIPLRMFVYPVSSDADVPAVFRENAATVTDPWALSPDDVAAHRADWVDRWAAVMGQ